MARPERNDADYFPFFAKRGKTLNILQAKYGLEGIGFFTNLLRFLTLTPYHHYQIKIPLDQMNLFAEIGIIDETRGVEILDLLATTGKIDYDLWHNYRVIVSESFLASLEDAYAKRNNKIITMDEIRVKYTGNPQATVLPVPETHKQEGYGVLKGVDNPQRKGKETKGKDIKEKEEPFFSDSPVPDFEDDIADAFNELPIPQPSFKKSTLDARLAVISETWKRHPELPKYVCKLSANMKPEMTTGIDAILQAYNDAQLSTAIDNYAIALPTIEPKYRIQSFQNFMANSGAIAKYQESSTGKVSTEHVCPICHGKLKNGQYCKACEKFFDENDKEMYV